MAAEKNHKKGELLESTDGSKKNSYYSDKIYYSVIKSSLSNCGNFLRTYAKYELIWGKRLQQIIIIIIK